MPIQPRRFSSTLAPDLALLSAALVWGTTFSLVKQALVYTTPFMFLTLRFGIAFAIMTIPVVWRSLRADRPGQPWLQITRREWIGGILTGVALYVGYTFQTWGLVYTSASRSAFITGLNVLLVPFMLWGLSRQVVSSKRWTSVLLATAGLYLLVDPTGSTGINIGDGLTLLCAVGLAAQIILLGIYSPTIDTIRYLWVQLLTVVVLSALSVWLTGTVEIRPALLLWWGLAITGILGTAAAFLAMTWAQRQVSPTRTALFLATEPIFGALYAVLLAGEYLSPSAWFGGLMIVAVVIWSEIGEVSLPGPQAGHESG